MLRFLVRDLALTALTIGAFALDGSLRAHGGAGAASIVVALVAGALAAVVGFLVHEWGHLAGALLTRSVVYFPTALTSAFLFHFDTRGNDRRQFLAMSVGGFVASLVSLAVMPAVLPIGVLSGKVALGLAALGVVATLTLEVPTYVRVLRGAPLPGGFVYEPFEAQAPKAR